MILLDKDIRNLGSKAALHPLSFAQEVPFEKTCTAGSAVGGGNAVFNVAGDDGGEAAAWISGVASGGRGSEFIIAVISLKGNPLGSRGVERWLI